jgi:hypothetical protein
MVAALHENRPRRRVVGLAGGAAAVAVHQVGGADGRDLPAVLGEPVGHLGAVLEVPQVLHVEGIVALAAARFLPVLLELFAPARQILRVEEPGTERLDGDATSARTELMDALEQQVLSVGGQIRQQTLGGPRSGLLGVETGTMQRVRPVVAQVDRHRHVPRTRCRDVPSQCLGLERKHLGLVDLVDHAVANPRQSPRPGVEAGGEDHRLFDSVGAGRDEELIEPLGPRRGVTPDRPNPLDHVRRRQVPALFHGGVDEHLRVRVGEQRTLGALFLGP